jgi:hypothetical protein
MESTSAKAEGQHAQAARILKQLDAIGAINLDVLVSKSAEIAGIAGLSELDPEDRICYPFIVRIGPRLDFDLVSVANQVKNLGFELRRVGIK